MKNTKAERGFTIVELMIVVAVIGVLAVIAIPGYIGMQDKARKGTIQRAAAAAVPEMQNWLLSACKGGSTLREIDTNANGVVEDTDLTNSDLAEDLKTDNQLCQRYINARWAANPEYSPWDPAFSLWTTALSSGAASNARIACNQPAGVSKITLEAWDKIGASSIYRKEISID